MDANKEIGGHPGTTPERGTKPPRFMKEQVVLNAIAKPPYGSRTYQITNRCGGLTRPQVYRLLVGLEAKGYVARSARYSSVNDIYWQLTPKGSGSGDSGTNQNSTDPSL